MTSKSQIEWTEHSWNPAVGCTKVSAGCKHCYAETMANRLKFMGTKGYENGFLGGVFFGEDDFVSCNIADFYFEFIASKSVFSFNFFFGVGFIF